MIKPTLKELLKNEDILHKFDIVTEESEYGLIGKVRFTEFRVIGISEEYNAIAVIGEENTHLSGKTYNQDLWELTSIEYNLVGIAGESGIMRMRKNPKWNMGRSDESDEMWDLEVDDFANNYGVLIFQKKPSLNLEMI